MPAGLVDAVSIDASITAVVPDEDGGARAAVAVLLAAGHTRIGFLNSAEDVPATLERLRGFRATLTEARLDGAAAPVESEPSQVRGGYDAARRMLARSNRPTGLFCFNDRMAMGAYRAAAELGLAIPADLSVVGFDDQELIAANLYPGLTTVALPHYKMGAWATETLIDAIEGKTDLSGLAVRPTTLECPVVVRGSVAPPPVH
jgi:LacI family transcriptional regulator